MEEAGTAFFSRTSRLRRALGPLDFSSVTFMLNSCAPDLRLNKFLLKSPQWSLVVTSVAGNMVMGKLGNGKTW